MRALRDIRKRDGFTLIELLIVVAIIGAVVAIAAPKLTAYRTHEDARALADQIRLVLSDARTMAIANGRPQFVLFDSPAIPEWDAGAIALTVDDLDGSFTISTGDNTTNAQPRPGLIGTVDFYGEQSSPFPTAVVPDEDATGGPLSALNSGTSFVDDPVTNVPAIGFTAQGIPVSLSTPTNFGSGAGAVYVTDGDSLVLAVIVQPLGAIRIRVLQPGSSSWF
ncbi:MAG: type II secretion system protein [bacterium]|nr:type II secretion system protein [bacterium]